MNRRYIACCLSLLLAGAAQARVGGYGDRGQVNVQNRTANRSVNQNANVNRNVNSNTNVNRNVNVNQNVNVNRNVNVSGGYYGGAYYHDNDWNWGSFAAGAAAGAVTGAVVSAATHPSTTTVVAAPVAVGTVVTALPGGCATVAGAAGAIYSCGNVYYRPYYQGTALVYQVVTYP
jgi:hypothetical protein